MDAISAAGLQLLRTGTLDKTQGSLKQVTTRGAVKGDSVLLLGRVGDQLNGQHRPDPWTVVATAIRDLPATSPKRHRHRLYGLFVNSALEQGGAVPVSAEKFYAWLESRYAERDDRVFESLTR
jgi:hypothetical protein